MTAAEPEPEPEPEPAGCDPIPERCTHCVHWWDDDGPCCWCAYAGDDE